MDENMMQICTVNASLVIEDISEQIQKVIKEAYKKEVY
jgi:hypothetical protein